MLINLLTIAIFVIVVYLLFFPFFFACTRIHILHFGANQAVKTREAVINAMWGSRPRYRRNVKALLDRSARFLSSLLHGVPNASFLLRLNAPSLWGKSECTPEEWQRCLGELLCRGAAANCLLDTKSHVVEVYASLVAAFLPKPHWNNSITHSMDIISLSSLEKEVFGHCGSPLAPTGSFLVGPTCGGGREKGGVSHDSFIHGIAQCFSCCADLSRRASCALCWCW
ncbi:hypothetical protein TCDM_09800 [Trypanosoma cruzi Dm28c]|uniref:Uncharacterized protein n=1 Tax=Trypanosoma cruzi Dm28c TaxID=1416333 RepID=V5AP76_TRYCR|nr:hypothetical protein TCDM_09800 [Trypanosoma cruzi Dm28c]